MSNDRRGAEHPVFKNAGGMGVDEARHKVARPQKLKYQILPFVFSKKGPNIKRTNLPIIII